MAQVKRGNLFLVLTLNKALTVRRSCSACCFCATMKLPCIQASNIESIRPLDRMNVEKYSKVQNVFPISSLENMSKVTVT